MKARRTKKTGRLQGGFADLMTTPSGPSSAAGVITGVARNPGTSKPETALSPRTMARSPIRQPLSPPSNSHHVLSAASAPPDDWESLLTVRPKRRVSPQKPLFPSSSSFSGDRQSSLQAASHSADVSSVASSQASSSSKQYPPDVESEASTFLPAPSTSCPIPSMGSHGELGNLHDNSIHLNTPRSETFSESHPTFTLKVGEKSTFKNASVLDSDLNDSTQTDAEYPEKYFPQGPEPACDSQTKNPRVSEIDVEKCKDILTESPAEYPQQTLSAEPEDTLLTNTPRSFENENQKSAIFATEPNPVSSFDVTCNEPEDFIQANSTWPTENENPKNTVSSDLKPVVPSFLSGWDGADGWRDDLPEDSDSAEDDENNSWDTWTNMEKDATLPPLSTSILPTETAEVAQPLKSPDTTGCPPVMNNAFSGQSEKSGHTEPSSVKNPSESTAFVKDQFEKLDRESLLETSRSLARQPESATVLDGKSEVLKRDELSHDKSESTEYIPEVKGDSDHQSKKQDSPEHFSETEETTIRQSDVQKPQELVSETPGLTEHSPETMELNQQGVSLLEGVEHQPRSFESSEPHVQHLIVDGPQRDTQILPTNNDVAYQGSHFKSGHDSLLVTNPGAESRPKSPGFVDTRPKDALGASATTQVPFPAEEEPTDRFQVRMESSSVEVHSSSVLTLQAAKETPERNEIRKSAEISGDSQLQAKSGESGSQVKDLPINEEPLRKPNSGSGDSVNFKHTLAEPGASEEMDREIKEVVFEEKIGQLSAQENVTLDLEAEVEAEPQGDAKPDLWDDRDDDDWNWGSSTPQTDMPNSDSGNDDKFLSQVDKVNTCSVNSVECNWHFGVQDSIIEGREAEVSSSHVEPAFESNNGFKYGTAESASFSNSTKGNAPDSNADVVNLSQDNSGLGSMSVTQTSPRELSSKECDNKAFSAQLTESNNESILSDTNDSIAHLNDSESVQAGKQVNQDRRTECSHDTEFPSLPKAPELSSETSAQVGRPYNLPADAYQPNSAERLVQSSPVEREDNVSRRNALSASQFQENNLFSTLSGANEQPITGPDPSSIDDRAKDVVDPSLNEIDARADLDSSNDLAETVVVNVSMESGSEPNYVSLLEKPIDVGPYVTGEGPVNDSLDVNPSTGEISSEVQPEDKKSDEALGQLSFSYTASGAEQCLSSGFGVNATDHFFVSDPSNQTTSINDNFVVPFGKEGNMSQEVSAPSYQDNFPERIEQPYSEDFSKTVLMRTSHMSSNAEQSNPQKMSASENIYSATPVHSNNNENFIEDISTSFVGCDSDTGDMSQWKDTGSQYDNPVPISKSHDEKFPSASKTAKQMNTFANADILRQPDFASSEPQNPQLSRNDDGNMVCEDEKPTSSPILASLVKSVVSGPETSTDLAGQSTSSAHAHSGDVKGAFPPSFEGDAEVSSRVGVPNFISHDFPPCNDSGTQVGKPWDSDNNVNSRGHESVRDHLGTISPNPQEHVNQHLTMTTKLESQEVKEEGHSGYNSKFSFQSFDKSQERPGEHEDRWGGVESAFEPEEISVSQDNVFSGWSEVVHPSQHSSLHVQEGNSVQHPYDTSHSDPEHIPLNATSSSNTSALAIYTSSNSSRPGNEKSTAYQNRDWSVQREDRSDPTSDYDGRQYTMFSNSRLGHQFISTPRKGPSVKTSSLGKRHSPRSFSSQGPSMILQTQHAEAYSNHARPLLGHQALMRESARPETEASNSPPLSHSHYDVSPSPHHTSSPAASVDSGLTPFQSHSSLQHWTSSPSRPTLPSIHSSPDHKKHGLSQSAMERTPELLQNHFSDSGGIPVPVSVSSLPKMSASAVLSKSSDRHYQSNFFPQSDAIDGAYGQDSEHKGMHLKPPTLNSHISVSPPHIAESRATVPLPYNPEVGYSYSALDPGASADIDMISPRATFSWGFGGLLVLSVSSAINDQFRYQVQRSSMPVSSPKVELICLTDIISDIFDDDVSAANEAVSPILHPNQTSDLATYADMCHKLSRAPSCLPRSAAESRGSLWRLLGLMCTQPNGDWKKVANTVLTGPSAIKMFGHSGSASRGGATFTEDSPLYGHERMPVTSDDQNLAAVKIEKLLMTGNMSEAAQVAVEAQLWAIAFALSAYQDDNTHRKVVIDYSRNALKNCSALQTSCLAYAGSFAEIFTLATSVDGLNNWRKIVGVLLGQKSLSQLGKVDEEEVMATVRRIGDGLLSIKKDSIAAHICYILSGQLKILNKSTPLLGGDVNIPAGRPCSFGSVAVILQSLVFDSVSNVHSGSTSPHLLPFRLILCGEIAAVGRPDIALLHCESVVSLVKAVFESGDREIAAETFTAPFLSSLESLELRLRGHLNPVEQRKRSGAFGVLERSLSSLLSKAHVARKPKPAVQVENKPKHTNWPLQQSSNLSNSALTGSISKSSVPGWHPSHSRTLVEQERDASDSGAAINNLVDTVTRNKRAPTPETESANNERLISFVSKTVNMLAPGGDLSPPPRTRTDLRYPDRPHEDPSFGLGGQTGSRLVGAGMRSSRTLQSSSTGNVPDVIEKRQQPSILSDEKNIMVSRTLSNDEMQLFRSGPTPSTAVTQAPALREDQEKVESLSDREVPSDKKPPRVPKMPGASSSDASVNGESGKRFPKGWRARIADKLMSTFGGAKKAHMGEKNQFVFDKERNRWVIPGEDPNAESALPPPPPTDNDFDEIEQKAPKFSSSSSFDDATLHYSIEQPIPRSPSVENAVAPPAGMQSGGYESSYSRMASFNSASETSTSRIDYNREQLHDNSQVSTVQNPDMIAPSTQSAQVMTNPMASNLGNKYRAGVGRLAGRKAYVDTFNKAKGVSTQANSTSKGVMKPSPPLPPQGGIPRAGVQIFTPNAIPQPQTGVNSNDAGTVKSSSIIEAQSDPQSFQYSRPSNTFASSISPMHSTEVPADTSISYQADSNQSSTSLHPRENDSRQRDYYDHMQFSNNAAGSPFRSQPNLQNDLPGREMNWNVSQHTRAQSTTGVKWHPSGELGGTQQKGERRKQPRMMA